MDIKDYYKILNVDREASRTDIKKAYHKMAKTYHPDVNVDKSGCEERLKEMNEAYGILGDERKRMQYDRMTDPTINSRVFNSKSLNNESKLSQDRFCENDSMKQRYGCKGSGVRNGGCKRNKWSFWSII